MISQKRRARAAAAGALFLACAACLDAPPPWSGTGAAAGADGRIIYSRMAEGGHRDLWRAWLDGSKTEPFLESPEDKIPVANLEAGKILLQTSGGGWQALASCGGKPPTSTPITPAFERVSLLSIVGPKLLFGTGRAETNIFLADWQEADGAAVDLFPNHGGGDNLLGLTVDGWLVATTRQGGIASSFLRSGGSRVTLLANPGARFESLTNDGQVIYSFGERLFAADPDGSSTWQVPIGEGGQVFLGLSRDDRIFYQEKGLLLGIRIGDAAPTVLMEGLPAGFEGRVDYKDRIVVALGGSLVRFSPWDSSQLLLAQEPEPIGFLRLHGHRAYYKTGTVLRSVSLEGLQASTLADRADQIRQILFLPNDIVGLMDDSGSFVTLYADGRNRTVILEGEKIRGVQVLDTGRLILEVEREGQGDILATRGPFSKPYPVANSSADESNPLVLP